MPRSIRRCGVSSTRRAISPRIGWCTTAVRWTGCAPSRWAYSTASTRWWCPPLRCIPALTRWPPTRSASTPAWAPTPTSATCSICVRWPCRPARRGRRSSGSPCWRVPSRMPSQSISPHSQRETKRPWMFGRWPWRTRSSWWCSARTCAAAPWFTSSPTWAPAFGCDGAAATGPDISGYGSWPAARGRRGWLTQRRVSA